MTLKLLGPALPPCRQPASLIAAGATEEPRALAAALADDLQPELRAYARLLEGEIALRERRYVAASEALRGVRDLADLWWSRLALGIAYVEAGHPAEALGELEQCRRKRQGEATAILLDDLPSIRYLAPLPVLAGPRAGRRLGQSPAARATNSEFLRIRSRPKGSPIRLWRMAATAGGAQQNRINPLSASESSAGSTGRNGGPTAGVRERLRTF